LVASDILVIRTLERVIQEKLLVLCKVLIIIMSS